MFKFLHAADVHLDSPLLGLQRYEGAPVEQMRRATRREEKCPARTIPVEQLDELV